MPRFIAILIAAAAVLTGAAGCSTNVESVDSSAPPAAVAPPAADSKAPPVAAAPSPASGVPAVAPSPASGGPAAATATPAASGDHEARRRKAEELEAAYRHNPNDTEAKARLVRAKYEYASLLMEDQNVPPMQKYRPALKAFRELLALQPDHAGAKERKELIESIYRSMGLPIPN